MKLNMISCILLDLLLLVSMVLLKCTNSPLVIHLMMIPGWTTLTSQQRHPNYLIRQPFRQIRASKKSCGPPGFSDLFTYFVTDT